MKKGAAYVLGAQLQRKFGPLPDWVHLRIDGADEATLNNWAIQVLDAQSIEDVLGDI